MVCKESYSVCLTYINVSYDKVWPLYWNAHFTRVMWSSRAPLRAHHVLQFDPSCRFKQNKLSHFSGKAREKPTRLASKRLNYSDASSWTRRNRMWVEVLGNLQVRTKCLSSSPAARGKFLSMWNPSDTYDLLPTTSFWNSGDTSISIYCITAKRRRDRIVYSYMNCEIWWVNRSCSSVYQDIWPNSSLAYKLWICIAH